jgi:hypothetical protein
MFRAVFERGRHDDIVIWIRRHWPGRGNYSQLHPHQAGSALSTNSEALAALATNAITHVSWDWTSING